MLDSLTVPGWLDVLDIALVAALVWLAIRSIRRTRARAALLGLALLGVVYFFARILDLRLTASIFQGFFAVVVLVLVVVFQEDLRRVFEQLGSLRRGRRPTPPASETLDVLVRAVARLAATRTGALIVLPGQELLDRHVEGGVALGGRVSEPLLLSIFDASSPGHDGAVLLRGGRVERFALHLPLSANQAALGPGGTRHAAALGLAERCDAVCIVVSEERGTVSLAREGDIRVLSRPEDLVAELGERFQPPAARPWWQGRVGLDAVIAMAAAVVLWMVFVPGSSVTDRTLEAPIEVTNLPPDLVLESVEPGAVEVTLRGLRRDLLLAERGGLSVPIDAFLARLGRRTFTISPESVRAPGGLDVEAVRPDKVKISLRASPQAEAVEPAAAP